jgi:hypothetical protein
MNLPMLGATMIYVKSGRIAEQLLDKFVVSFVYPITSTIYTDGHDVQ